MRRRKRMEITIETRRLVIRSKRQTPVWCPKCSSPVQSLTPEEVAVFANVSTRAVYHWVEAAQLHLIETAEQSPLICLNSLCSLTDNGEEIIMSQSTLLPTPTTTNQQPIRKGTRLMLGKRILWTLLLAAMIVISATATQAQSARKLWPRGDSGNNPIPVAPEQATPIVELEITSRVAQTTVQGGGMPDIHEPMKTAIVGSWLGTSSEGNRLLLTFNSDETSRSSVQTEVSTIPELGVLTPGHGVWKYLGGRQFGFTSIGIIYDINTGAYMGSLKARALLTLNEAGDQMTGTDKVEVFDPDGNLVFTATGTTTFKRIKFEPFN